MMTYYKALEGLRAPVAGSGYRYPGVGRWTRHLDPTELEHYAYGYHVVQRNRLVEWLQSTIYEAEVCPDHEPLVTEGKTITCRVKLTHRFDTWNERTARLFAADVAEHVLPHARDEDRAMLANVLTVVRRYARGEATDQELAAARAAGYAAGVAGVAAWAAAWAADAGYAAGYAARAAARVAAKAAGAAWDAEREWQTDRLFAYLEGRAGWATA